MGPPPRRKEGPEAMMPMPKAKHAINPRVGAAHVSRVSDRVKK